MPTSLRCERDVEYSGALLAPLLSVVDTANVQECVPKHAYKLEAVT